MGIKQVELVPINTSGPTTTIPGAKNTIAKYFQVTRTDTASAVKCVLPACASVVQVTVYGSTASDAATTATVTLTIANNSGTISTGTVDVKTNGATTAFVQMTNLPNIESIPAAGDLRISAVYAETGTASTTGGPWKFGIDWV
jgi:hypothetical protein